VTCYINVFLLELLTDYNLPVRSLTQCLSYIIEHKLTATVHSMNTNNQ